MYYLVERERKREKKKEREGEKDERGGKGYRDSLLLSVWKLRAKVMEH